MGLDSQGQKIIMALEQAEFSVQLPMTFHHLKASEPQKPLVLFLHGYTDSGSSLLRRALKGAELSVNILAPNGPFPLPVMSEKGFKEAYAWYFWEYATDKMVIHPRVAVGMLKKLIKDLGYEKTPKVIVGFSQGGFLAPYLLPEIKNVKALIAVGSAFRAQDYPQEVLHPVIAIHGAQDKVITIERARESLLELAKKKGVTYEFHPFENLDHTIDGPASKLLIEKINSFLV